MEAAASIQTLADYAKNNAKLPLLGENIYNDKELTTLLFQFYSQSFLGENGDLDQEGLIRFLECLKVIRNQTKANQGEQEEVGGNWLAAEAIFKGKSELGLISINGMFDTYVPFAAQEKIKGELTSVKQKLFIPKGLVGVNNASKNKDLAFAFVKQLYAEEVQVISLGDGFPVNRKVIEKFELEESDGEFRLDGIEVAQPSLEKMQSILNLCKTLTTPVNDDKKLLEMITRETVPYLSGKADVARTADKIMQRVKTYLSE